MTDIDHAGSIQAIDKSSTHKICSGQVILSLSSAVKELIENSLDAGATNIEIRTKEYGSELIEVVDNGCGVDEKNFKELTLKHYTSKLKDFNDLTNVETFGFRGEALSSLCALSNITVTTRSKTIAVGTQLEYDQNGLLIKQISVPRQVGTTVSVKNLFATLPVRHKEFIKNLRREFNKMIQLITSYCLVCTNVRLSCVNYLSNGRKTTFLSTNGCFNIKENIACIFTSKQAFNLLEFSKQWPSKEIIEEFSLSTLDLELYDSFKIEGYISNCEHGEGRSSSDRQFFYINGRPCDLQKVSKLMNEVYHNYNKHQYPFIFLDIKIVKENVDMNVTPDKRKIFLQNEKLLLALIKMSLISVYESKQPILSSLQCQKNKIDFICSTNKPKIPDEYKIKSNIGNLKRSLSVFLHSHNVNDEKTSLPRKLSAFDSEDMKNRTSSTFINSSNKPKKFLYKATINKLLEIEKKHKRNPSFNVDPFCQSYKMSYVTTDKSEIINSGTIEDEQFIIQETNMPDEIILDECKSKSKKLVNLEISMENLRKSYHSQRIIKESKELYRKFKAKIETKDNKNAEEELKKEINKEMFAKMKIIGQFNKGFIITKLDSDLFIIDQHATDEKYNYEIMQQNDVLEMQKMIHPVCLNLTAINESILIENIEIFRKNGFDFEINNNAESGQKIKLTSLPISQTWSFGKEDIEEMLFLLIDYPGKMCRPSRVYQMLASRACRKSVMIGTALSHKDMRKLVNHMGEIEQPWNCPHGRPTIRHLFDLSLLTGL